VRGWFLTVAALAGALGCVSDVDESGASATYSADLTVTSARLTAGFVTYGTPVRSFKIRLIASDSCDAATIAELEINLSQTETLPVVGAIPFRVETNPTVLPSALFRGAAATLVSGTINLTAVTAGRLDGTFDAMLVINGVPTPVTGGFAAPTCP
jgi:hypothetical protein